MAKKEVSYLTPYPYQASISQNAYEILAKYGMVFLAMEERTGKSLTSLLVCERCSNVQHILIITKKRAISGWDETISRFENTKNLKFTIMNFESLHKLEGSFDLAIIDEAHYAISSYPKPSRTFLATRRLVWNLPCIFLSATPSAESFSQLFHELNVTKYSPFSRYRSFYEWHRVYGIPCHQWISGRKIEKYNEVKVHEVVSAVEHLFISFSRNDLGFKYEPTDRPVFIELSSRTKQLMLKLKNSKVLEGFGLPYTADTIVKELTALHQLEGGTLKLSDSSAVETGATEKIDCILSTYGDSESLAIMYNYVAEKNLLKKHFKKALIVQGTAFAEGIDLSHYKQLVVYSMNFSASKFIQRRARQCNLSRDEPIVVDYLLCKGCISEMVYNAIINDKMSFTQTYYAKNKSKFEKGDLDE